jgi:hypothetical protein
LQSRKLCGDVADRQRDMPRKEYSIGDMAKLVAEVFDRPHQFL